MIFWETATYGSDTTHMLLRKSSGGGISGPYCLVHQHGDQFLDELEQPLMTKCLETEKRDAIKRAHHEASHRFIVLNRALEESQK